MPGLRRRPLGKPLRNQRIRNHGPQHVLQLGRLDGLHRVADGPGQFFRALGGARQVRGRVPRLVRAPQRVDLDVDPIAKLIGPPLHLVRLTRGDGRDLRLRDLKHHRVDGRPSAVAQAHPQKAIPGASLTNLNGCNQEHGMHVTARRDFSDIQGRSSAWSIGGTRHPTGRGPGTPRRRFRKP